MKIGVDPANLSRELQRLEKEGIFLSEKQGLQKYFFINKKFTLYREFKSVIAKTFGCYGSVEVLLKAVPGIRRAFIYGSFAKNSERAGSDMDLCLVVRKGQFKEDALLAGVRKLENELGREIDYTFFTEEEWQSKQRDRDSFVLGLLKGKRIELIHEKD